MDCYNTCTTTRRPCFIEKDNGLASLADMEAEFSGNDNSSSSNNNNNGLYSRTVCPLRRRSSLRSLASVSSPRSVTTARFYDARYEDNQTHFLQSCFLCKKPLGDNRDIFMYRGDTPFCSEECRQEQIDIDEAKEKNWNLSSSMEAMRKKDQKKKSTSPSKKQDYPYRTSTLAAA